MTIAIVGLGAWGKNLARNFLHLGALSAVCSPDLEVSAWEGIPVRGFNEILADPSILGVVIATPTPSHHPLALAALMAGKHAFVEKPLTATLAQAEELVSLARAKGLKLMMGHLMRYHPCFEGMIQLVAQGTLGQIQTVTLRRANFGRFRDYESVVQDLAPHDLSMLMALGVTITEASWQVVNHSPQLSSFPDQVAFTFESTRDSTPIAGSLFFSRTWPLKEQLVVVQGSLGCAVFDDTKPWDQKLWYGLYDHSGPEPTLVRTSVVPAPAEPLKLECAHFIQCCLGAPCHTPGDDGLAIVACMARMVDA